MIKTAVDDFLAQVSIMESALETLRNEIKEQGKKNMETHIDQGQFDHVIKLTNELKSFSGIKFSTNATDIAEFALNMFEGGSRQRSERTPQASYANMTVITSCDRDLEETETELIKTIGQTAASRTKEMAGAETEALESLSSKGYILVETIELGGDTQEIFELTEEGKEMFVKLCGTEPNESMKAQLEKKFSSAEKGFFIFDIEQALQEREYQIQKTSANQIEIAKDNKFCYLMPDIGKFSDQEYNKILDRTNQLKNIGFICADENVMSRAKAATRKWIDKNQNKCKFLSINFTTLVRIQRAPNIFETISL